MKSKWGFSFALTCLCWVRYFGLMPNRISAGFRGNEEMRPCANLRKYPCPFTQKGQSPKNRSQHFFKMGKIIIDGFLLWYNSVFIIYFILLIIIYVTMIVPFMCVPSALWGGPKKNQIYLLRCPSVDSSPKFSVPIPQYQSLRKIHGEEFFHLFPTSA